MSGRGTDASVSGLVATSSASHSGVPIQRGYHQEESQLSICVQHPAQSRARSRCLRAA
ncbi:hypothetical protein D3C84_918000 [compost metagenome]